MSWVTRIGIDAKVLSIDFRTDCSKRDFLTWNNWTVSWGDFFDGSDGPGSDEVDRLTAGFLSFMDSIFSNTSNKFSDSSVLEQNFKHLSIILNTTIFQMQTFAFLCTRSHAWPEYNVHGQRELPTREAANPEPQAPNREPRAPIHWIRAWGSRFGAWVSRFAALGSQHAHA